MLVKGVPCHSSGDKPLPVPTHKVSVEAVDNDSDGSVVCPQLYYDREYVCIVIQTLGMQSTETRGW